MFSQVVFLQSVTFNSSPMTLNDGWLHTGIDLVHCRHWIFPCVDVATVSYMPHSGHFISPCRGKMYRFFAFTGVSFVVFLPCVSVFAVLFAILRILSMLLLVVNYFRHRIPYLKQSQKPPFHSRITCIATATNANTTL